MTGFDKDKKRDVFLGHYFDMAAAGGKSGTAPAEYSPSELIQYKMNKRDQSLSHNDEDSLSLVSDVIKWAKYSDVLIMLDPKIPANAESDEYEHIIAIVLNQAYEYGALSNIAIKTTNEYDDSIIKIKKYLNHPLSEYIGKFLWSPIPNKSDSIDISDVLNSIDKWHLSTDKSKSVAMYEISLYSEDYPGSKPFVYNDVSYYNLFDYIRQLTPLGKRFAVWSIDPMSDKGTLGRVYNWKFIGNTPTDRRGDPLQNLSYRYGLYAAVNTDIPATYTDMVTDPYSN